MAAVNTNRNKKTENLGWKKIISDSIVLISPNQYIITSWRSMLFDSNLQGLTTHRDSFQDSKLLISIC